MKEVEINKNACIGCGLCVQLNNEVFDYDDDGKSKVIKQTVNEEIENIANMCPTNAILIKEK